MAKRAQTVDYLHCRKDGKEYALSFHTKAGVSEVPGRFSGDDVDKIRAHERRQKGKKLSDAQWEEFFNTIM